MFIELFEDQTETPDSILYETAAKTITALKEKDKILGALLQYIIDSAADQFIGEEFYSRAPHLLHFFVQLGTNNEEVLFLDFIQRHQIHCRNEECNDQPLLLGGCPLMYCPTCGRKYFIDVSTISETICKRCAARDRECSERSRKYAYRIFFTEGA